MLKNFFFLFLYTLCVYDSQAQELLSQVTVVTSRVNNQVPRSTFVTLEKALNNFVNNRKWTNDKFAANERIKANFLLNIESTTEPNIYSGFLTVQAARPIFNTSYSSPIINFKDEAVYFKYIEFQQLDFNENRVTGTQPLQDNLTAIFAYYVNVILAFDYESFAPKGGIPYLLKAQNIINNAPDGRGITGWKAFDGLRNRYWLIENMLNTKYVVMHDVYYDYYRNGLDQFYEKETEGRVAVMKVLEKLETFNTDNPNTMINQFFFQGKGSELLRIFSKAPPGDKQKALAILTKYDINNAALYREGLK